MRRTHKCGHTGKGQWCHRCERATVLEERAKKEEDPGRAVCLEAEARRLKEEGKG